MSEQNIQTFHPTRAFFAIIGVSFFGLITLFLTRYIFYTTHPEYFIGATPSISRVAAFDPASDVFMLGMCLASFCGLIGWFIVLKSNLSSYRSKDHIGRCLARATAALGILAVLFLTLLAIVDSNWNGPLHELFSICFFLLQILAFMCDAIWLKRARHYGLTVPNHVHRFGTYKIVISLILAGLGVLFLLLYLLDNNNIFTDEQNLKLTFVIVEYAIAVLCFIHPIAQYREQSAFWRTV